MKDTNSLPLIVIRGAGDLASGLALRLYHAGLRKILFLETENPLAVRRTVAFCEAVHTNTATVEGVQSVLVQNIENLQQYWDDGRMPLFIDKKADCLDKLKANVLVDATLAKKNLGTHKGMAELVIGVGPGFSSAQDGDVHVVIESMRGHTLGRVIGNGAALANTGVPEAVKGYTSERVFWAEFDGIFTTTLDIRSAVKKGDVLGKVSNAEQEQLFTANFDGVVRGILRSGTLVTQRTKLGDVDPRGQVEYCDLVSDKGLSIGGGVLEVVVAKILGNR